MDESVYTGDVICHCVTGMRQVTEKAYMSRGAMNFVSY